MNETKKWKVSYDIYGSNREVPLYHNTKKVEATSAEEAIEILKSLVGGRNYKAELIEDCVAGGIVEEKTSAYSQFNQRVNQALNAATSGNHKRAKYHLDVARSYMLGLNTAELDKIKDAYKIYKDLRKKYSGTGGDYQIKDERIGNAKIIREDFTKMPDHELKQWINTRQQNAMASNLSFNRQQQQLKQAQDELNKRKRKQNKNSQAVNEANKFTAGPSDKYKVGDKVETYFGGRWWPGVITKPPHEETGNYGVRFVANKKTHNSVSSLEQLRPLKENFEPSSLTFKQYLIESSTKHDLFVGRFQPFHKGHANVVAGMKNPIIAVVKGKATSEDKQNNPLSFAQQKSLINTTFPNATVIEVANANLYGMLYHLNNEGKNIGTVFAGEDRLESYKKAVEKSNKETGKNTTVKQTPRFTSATTVRDTIRSDKFDEFKKLMPSELANEKTFKMLQSAMTLSEGRESEYGAWAALSAQAEKKRQQSGQEEKDAAAQRFAHNMRANQLKVFQAELAKHKEALAKTTPGSKAHGIIAQRVAQYQDKIKQLG